jgi:hypothetical protein
MAQVVEPLPSKLKTLYHQKQTNKKTNQNQANFSSSTPELVKLYVQG